MEEVTGYAHPGYAASLSEFGTPRLLPRSGGWILERRIPGCQERDAMGCYPLFACQHWSQLHADLDEIGSELVSVTLVTDPFGGYQEGLLRQCFPDQVVPFKEHFVADLRSITVSKHHRYYARKALEKVTVEACDQPARFIDEWIRLYATLIQRHDLKGIKAFSREALAKQLSLPGSFLFRATHDSETVGAHLWYANEEVAYSHLTAFSPLGYEFMTAYALYWFAIEYFRSRVRWLDLGATSGALSSGSDGLTQFKRGWSNGMRTAYLCGRIFDHKRYAEVLETRGIGANNYFPAYRQGEFT